MRISDWSSDVCSSDLPHMAGTSNRLDTDRSSLMRCMASPISGAIEIWRMFWATRTASVAWMLSVMTNSSSGEELTLATAPPDRSEEHTSELQSLMRTSNAVFCMKKKQ